MVEPTLEEEPEPAPQTVSIAPGGEEIVKCTQAILSATTQGNWSVFETLCDQEMTSFMPGQGQQLIQVTFTPKKVLYWFVVTLQWPV